VPEGRITREDVAAAVGARQELGEELEPAVVDAFLDKVEVAIEARATAQRTTRRRDDYGDHAGQRLALAIVSLGTGIPITAIAAEQGGVLGIVVAWAGIVGVNFANAFKRD
jgi:hypothetical protein